MWPRSSGGFGGLDAVVSADRATQAWTCSEAQVRTTMYQCSVSAERCDEPARAAAAVEPRYRKFNAAVKLSAGRSPATLAFTRTAGKPRPASAAWPSPPPQTETPAKYEPSKTGSFFTPALRAVGKSEACGRKFSECLKDTDAARSHTFSNCSSSSEK